MEWRGQSHKCLSEVCGGRKGDLIPLSDYGPDGASVPYKAWACTNPECGFSLRIDKGEVTYGRRIREREKRGVEDLGRAAAR